MLWLSMKLTRFEDHHQSLPNKARQYFHSHQVINLIYLWQGSFDLGRSQFQQIDFHYPYVPALLGLKRSTPRKISAWTKMFL